MRYKNFIIENYRAIKKKLTIDLDKRIIPLVGINECGKTTILQAILCFDSSNDDQDGGKHLDSLKNLYETDSGSIPTVTATIETEIAELKEAVGDIVDKYKSSSQAGEDNSLIKYERMLERSDASQHITIQMHRNLAEKKYYFSDYFNNLPEDTQDEIGHGIVMSLPYTLYNDDFNDRPPDSIPITTDTKKAHTGWEDIFDRVFASANSSYSPAKCLQNADEKIRRSILSDVENYLSNALTNEWRKFSPKSENISIQLDINKATKTLDVFIKDYLNGHERFFSISDRSKGFIWYYNFIMKVRFNPKYVGNIKDTIFLLDEPGSYLHETAQENLCKKLKDISAAEGIVVFCTHSPHLLLPQYIPINNIIIVNKTSGKYITVKHLSDGGSSLKRSSALQPVYDALMMPEYETITKGEKVLCVEGIYDKYALESFASIPDNCRVLAGVNANSIITNIQYLIAYQKEYLALWDNDEEGRKCYGQAKSAYGEHESRNFMLLPAKEQGKRRMEEMFEPEDLTLLKHELGLPVSANYNSVMLKLYYLEPSRRTGIVQMVSEPTKNTFQTLSQMIQKHFSS